MRTLLFAGVLMTFGAGLASEFLAQQLTPLGDTPTVDLGALVSGRVVGPGDQPKAGVPIQVEGPLGTTHVFTDINGNWSLYNVQPGTYAVRPAGKVASPNPGVQFTVKEFGLFRQAQRKQ